MSAFRVGALGLLALLSLAAPALAQDELTTGEPLPPPSLTPEEEGLLFPIDVIFTNLPGDPSSAVPGLVGVSFGPGTSGFDRPFGSPNGNWILSADTDLPTTEDEVILVNGTLGAREGTLAPWTGGENVGLVDTKLGINDSGNWVFATNTDGPTTGDEYLVSVMGGIFAAAAQEGQPGPLAGSTWGSTIDSGVIAGDNTIGLSSDALGGVPSTEDDVLVLGAGVLAQEGVTMPGGQLGMELWENFDLDDFWLTADGSSWLAQGDLTGDTTTDGVVAVDGTVVVQEGVVLPGSGFAEPVDTSGIVGVWMDPAGNWFVRGNNDVSEQDWIYRNGAVLATLGDPILHGSAESWTDAEFADCFFLHVGSSSGNYVLGGVSDGPTPTNGVLVLNQSIAFVRESDPLDLDGNGLFDDDVFFNTFGNDDGILTDDGLFYFVATLKDGAGTVIGQGFLVADLSSIGTPIFEDGFESGDTGAWSSQTGG
jgi:hypothetical protein